MDMITDLETRLKINKNPEIKSRIEKLRQVEILKEKKLKEYLGDEFYDNYLAP